MRIFTCSPCAPADYITPKGPTLPYALLHTTPPPLPVPTPCTPLHRDHDGRVALDEALLFAKHATGLSRGLKARDTLTAAALTQGHCSLAMWKALQQPGGKAAFVDWVVRLITQGVEAPTAHGWGVPCVGAAAVKNLYMLFDMEVSGA